MLNRRGFFGTLFGAAAVAAIPAPVKPVIPALSFHPVAFSFVTPPLDLSDFQAGYLNPAMEVLARDIDARCARFRYSPRITVADSKRFDPARLPL